MIFESFKIPFCQFLLVFDSINHIDHLGKKELSSIKNALPDLQEKEIREKKRSIDQKKNQIKVGVQPDHLPGHVKRKRMDQMAGHNVGQIHSEAQHRVSKNHQNRVILRVNAQLELDLKNYGRVNQSRDHFVVVFSIEGKNVSLHIEEVNKQKDEGRLGKCDDDGPEEVVFVKSEVSLTEKVQKCLREQRIIERGFYVLFEYPVEKKGVSGEGRVEEGNGPVIEKRLS